MKRARAKSILLAAAFSLMCGCTVETGAFRASETPASESGLLSAKQTAKTCSQFAPNANSVVRTLKQRGFRQQSDAQLDDQKAKLSSNATLDLLQNEDGVVVLVRSSRSRLFCAVALRQMTIEQGTQVAQVWARKYGATQERLFNAFNLKGDVLKMQAVRSRDFSEIGLVPSVRWLGAPGAAAILDYRTKDANAPVNARGTFTITKIR